VGILQGESTADIEAPLEQVWALVQDVERAPEWQGGMRAVTAAQRDQEGRVTLADTETDAKLRTIRSQVRFTYSEPTKLAWEQTRGDIKSVSGSWQLEQLAPDRTRATFHTAVDLGRLGLLIRGPIVDLLRAQLAGARAKELKNAIERDA